MSAANAVLDLLDKEACAVNMTGLVQLLSDHAPDEIKTATNELYTSGRLNRVPVMGPKGRYYAFYSLYVRTANGYVPPEASVAPIHDPMPAPAPDVAAELTTDQALAVLERAGWKPEPEVVEVERRVITQRAARFGIMDVIDRWKLGFRLSRIIEIVGGARNRKLTQEDAATVMRLIREHVKEAA